MTSISLTAPAAPALPATPDVPAFAANGWTWEAPTPFGYSIADAWVTSPTDVDAAPRELIGGQAALLHWDGVRWSRRPLPQGSTPAAQLSLGGGLLFARTEDGHVLRATGGAFVDLAAPIKAARIATPGDQDVWAFDSGGSTVTAAHWDGFTWTTSVIARPPAAHPEARAAVLSSWAGSPADVWVEGSWPWSSSGSAGEDPLVLHWDGAAWTSSSTGVLDGSSASGNLFGGAGWLTMPFVSAHDTGTGWQSLSCAGQWAPILPVWADLGSSGFASAVHGWDQSLYDGTGVVRIDGSACAEAAQTATRITALRASADSDVWAFGRGEVVRFDGTHWTLAGTNAGFGPNVIAGAGGALWGADGAGRLYRNEGGWHEEGSVPTGGLSALAVPAPGEVWAGGGAGALYHLHGGAWTRVDLGASSLTDVSASGDTVLVTAVQAGNAAVFRFAAGAWSVARIPGARSAWGASASDLYVAGDTALHWDGTAFSPVPGVQGATGVRGAGADVWFTGMAGVQRLSGGALSTIAPDGVAVAPASGGRAAIVRSNGVTLFDNGALTDLPAVTAGPGTTSVLDGTRVWLSRDGVQRYDL